MIMSAAEKEGEGELFPARPDLTRPSGSFQGEEIKTEICLTRATFWVWEVSVCGTVFLTFSRSFEEATFSVSLSVYAPLAGRGCVIASSKIVYMIYCCQIKAMKAFWMD